jgi:hypothetical protein
MGRGIGAFFTGVLHSRDPFGKLVSGNEFSGKPPLVRLLANVNSEAAPFSVTSLWTACTCLKTGVLTKAYFSLTQKIEGVQQDRSLTAS